MLYLSQKRLEIRELTASYFNLKALYPVYNINIKHNSISYTSSTYTLGTIKSNILGDHNSMYIHFIGAYA